MPAESGTSREKSAALTFLGAAKTVTGSRFLIDTETERLLGDCGLFQGQREWRRRDWDPLPVDPTSVGGVVLTHAHLDHCGYLPVLARVGWCVRGRFRIWNAVGPTIWSG